MPLQSLGLGVCWVPDLALHITPLDSKRARQRGNAFFSTLNGSEFSRSHPNPLYFGYRAHSHISTLAYAKIQCRRLSHERSSRKESDISKAHPGDMRPKHTKLSRQKWQRAHQQEHEQAPNQALIQTISVPKWRVPKYSTQPPTPHLSCRYSATNGESFPLLPCAP